MLLEVLLTGLNGLGVVFELTHGPLLRTSLCLEVIRHLLEEDDVVQVEVAVSVDETAKKVISYDRKMSDWIRTATYSEERGTTSLTNVS